MNLLHRFGNFLERLRLQFLETLLTNAELVQSLLGLARLTLAVLMLVMFALLGSELFEDFSQINAAGRAQEIQETNIFFREVPVWILALAVFFLDSHVIRYAIAPLLAILIVVMNGAAFVASVYNIPWFSALRYVLASLFAVGYPQLVIDGGEMRPLPNRLNLLDRIGGPGYALIQPGNAVLFRWLRRPSRVSIASSYFMSPFERFELIANLDEQHGSVEEISTLTRDGIRLRLQDIHFRYQILPETRSGRPARRSLEDPFPVSEEAIESMVNNLAVTEDGLEPWRRAVQRATVGVIVDYINAHSLDFLTAPRENEQDPRQRIQEELFSQKSRGALARLGAQLLWIDLGHFDIIEEAVDQKRLAVWAATLQGEAGAERATGEAKVLAYQELGRAEAQAELIAGIARALEDLDLTERDPLRLRKLLLLRAAQTLDALSAGDSNKEDKPT
ncbi:MAG: hypothetical protein IT308_09515 [Anaerolineaceae bacterium]|nr:hypothetical protein [Anaerolineaceae bacterium]